MSADDREWDELCIWFQDPSHDPGEWVFIDDGRPVPLGWVRASSVHIVGVSSVKPRGPRKVEPLAPRDDRLLTLQEAGAMVRASPETIRYWIWQGRLTAFKPGRNVLVRESELMALVAGRETRIMRAQRRKR